MKTNTNPLRHKPPASLAALFGKWLKPETKLGKPKRSRLFTPSRTFWMFLSQVLSQDGSCRETLRGFQAWVSAETGKTTSAKTTAYCKARARLPIAGLKKVSAQIVEKLSMAETPADRWCGRKIKVVDGSSVSMPDTQENQLAWPQPQKSALGCGFPVMRLAAIFSLTSGALISIACGSLHVHERNLLRKIWKHLSPGDVVLADRSFCGYADFFTLAGRGVDSVMRKHQRRGSGSVVLRKLGGNDRLVEWFKTGARPGWLSKKQWAQIPATLIVREITVAVAVKGFRTRSVSIATTLTDHIAFPADAFAELYFRRWRVELYLKDIKASLGMDILRCKTPKMVEKELWMHVIAYNLIRVTIQSAAAVSGVPIERLSFRGTLAALRQWAPVLAGNTISNKRRRELFFTMLDYIARDSVPDRPGRTEPRAKKRRGKNYQLLTRPRNIFREIPHRSKYGRA